MKNANRPLWNRAVHTTCGLLTVLTVGPWAAAQTPAPPPAAGTPAAGTPAPGSPAAGSTAAADPTNAQTSYLFGLTFGEQMHSVGISNQVDTDAIARGLKDGLQGKKSTRADQQQIQSFVQSVMAVQLSRNQAAAKEFLAKNGKEKGVKTTADGLEYKVIAAGETKAPAIGPNDEVTVNYRGKLLDGTEFDSSYSRGVPATFKVGGVIKGWQEAITLMKPGAKWELFIPPELAYNTSPRPGIPAGSLLIFDVELVGVKAAAAAPAGAALPAPTENPPASHKVMPPLKPTTPPPTETANP